MRETRTLENQKSAAPEISESFKAWSTRQEYAWLNMRNTEDSELISKSTRGADVRRLRLLWVGFVLYFLIMLNALRYAHVVPYQIFVLCSLVNCAILVTTFVAMRRIYMRLRK